MALILLYLLLLCIGTKCTHLICKNYDAHYDAYNLRVHIKAGWKKKEKFSKSFLFFINLRNNILHEYKYNGRYFGLYKKCEAIWREKKNVPFLLYLYISKYLLKYVILLILLTIKGFLNKNLFTCFWTLSRLLELDLLLSVTRLKDLCNH